MSGIEIALLIIGGVVFLVSFLLPGGKSKKESSDSTIEITEDQIKIMVEKEIDDAKQHIDEVVDETITYAMEKAERAMDRITNEKMLAVNEYSDTVLGEINKNHQEVVFLYDMLNDKHETLKSTVSQAAITASEVQQTVRDAEITAKEVEETAKSVREQLIRTEETTREEVHKISPLDFQQAEARQTDFQQTDLQQIDFQQIDFQQADFQQADFQQADFQPFQPQSIERVQVEKKPAKTPKKAKVTVPKPEETEIRDMNIHFKGNGTGGRNNNERILELHKAGKSNMAIAKDLGLGIGEVKLVIDLFEGAN